MKKFYTSESVRKGHPDKMCDIISDKILDAYLKIDKNSRVAIETMAYKNGILVSGEVTSKGKPDLEQIIRNTVIDIGYENDKLKFNGHNIDIKIFITKQSDDISIGINQDKIGAGDQGIMYGFATNETPNYMPYTQNLVNELAKKLDNISLSYLRPDGKCQITTEYNDEILKRIDSIIISVQTDDIDLNKIKNDIYNLVIIPTIPNNLIDEKTKIYINSTGKFVLGGPIADTGLTGRKIIIDTYGGFAKHGGGAFSGKDYTKVDRSAAYYARYVCKNIVASGLAKKMELQVAYGIGLTNEISLYINTFNTNIIPEEDILKIIKKYFDFSPSNIIKELNLKYVNYIKTTCYSHFGKKELPWEKLDKLSKLKEEILIYLK